jgi:hypothetical protein
MAEEVPTGEPHPTQQQGLQVRVDERDIRTLYVNMVRLHTTQEEVVMDLIFSMPNPNPGPGGQLEMLFKVSDRAIMSYPTAKKLAQSITQLVKRYEQQFGEVAVPGLQRPAQQR